MHEYHMVERVVLQAVEAAKENKATRINRITLVVGERAGIDPEAVKIHFAQTVAGTLAASAELVINRAGGPGNREAAIFT